MSGSRILLVTSDNSLAQRVISALTGDRLNADTVVLPNAPSLLAYLRRTGRYAGRDTDQPSLGTTDSRRAPLGNVLDADTRASSRLCPTVGAQPIRVAFLPNHAPSPPVSPQASNHPPEEP